MCVTLECPRCRYVRGDTEKDKLPPGSDPRISWCPDFNTEFCVNTVAWNESEEGSEFCPQCRKEIKLENNANYQGEYRDIVAGQEDLNYKAKKFKLKRNTYERKKLADPEWMDKRNKKAREKRKERKEEEQKADLKDSRTEIQEEARRPAKQGARGETTQGLSRQPGTSGFGVTEGQYYETDPRRGPMHNTTSDSDMQLATTSFGTMSLTSTTAPRISGAGQGPRGPGFSGPQDVVPEDTDWYGRPIRNEFSTSDSYRSRPVLPSPNPNPVPLSPNPGQGTPGSTDLAQYQYSSKSRNPYEQPGGSRGDLGGFTQGRVEASLGSTTADSSGMAQQPFYNYNPRTTPFGLTPSEQYGSRRPTKPAPSSTSDVLKGDSKKVDKKKIVKTSKKDQPKKDQPKKDQPKKDQPKKPH